MTEDEDPTATSQKNTPTLNSFYFLVFAYMNIGLASYFHPYDMWYMYLGFGVYFIYKFWKINKHWRWGNEA